MTASSFQRAAWLIFALYQSKKSATYCHVGKRLTAQDSLLSLYVQAPSGKIDGANCSRQFV